MRVVVLMDRASGLHADCDQSREGEVGELHFDDVCWVDLPKIIGCICTMSG